MQSHLQRRDLLAQKIGSVSHATNHAAAPGVGDRCSEVGAGSNVHSRQKYWVAHAEELRGEGTGDAGRKTREMRGRGGGTLDKGVEMRGGGVVMVASGGEGVNRGG